VGWMRDGGIVGCRREWSNRARTHSFIHSAIEERLSVLFACERARGTRRRACVWRVEGVRWESVNA